MRDHAAVSDEEKPLYLLPREITLCARYNVRPFSNASDEEDKRIELLAASIEASGQLDAVVITPNQELIAGHRRRRAIIVANERRSARGQPLLRVRCHVDPTGGDYRRKAIQSNLHRRDSSVMDLAYLITQIREEHDWRGWPGTKKVAEYLGVEPATVVNTEKFMGAERELQNKLHAGVISAQSAHDLMRASDSPGERQELLRRAAEIQVENRTDQIMEAFQSGRMRSRDAAANLRKQRDALEQPDMRIRHPAIVQAIREKHAATPRVNGGARPLKRIALTRAELLDALIQFDAPTYPLPVRLFARYFVEQYATGQGTSEELQQRVHALAQIFDTGSDPPPQHKLVTN